MKVKQWHQQVVVKGESDISFETENKLIIDTSPCQIIGTLSNLSWDRDRVLRGDNLTHFEYDIRQNEKWVRVEARDANGKKAWSNIFVV